jgi:hypothetical protein
MPATSINELAASLGTTPEHLRVVVQQTLRQLPRSRYYVFRVTGDRPVSPGARDQPRTVAAFPSPDDALAFAQRNGFSSNAQLRPVAAADLVLRMLSDASIGWVLFLQTTSGSSRGFGPGLKLARDKLIAELRNPAVVEQTAAPVTTEEKQMERMELPMTEGDDLTAANYDALQFGVNFTRRAEFRVALAQAVDQVVDQYQPPEGSIDRGPRSIFATTAVEEWLRKQGFPHAFQRRWIDVADDERWGDAIELCEIDCGTQNHLLVQLLIHQDDEGRQYIKQVNVTA